MLQSLQSLPVAGAGSENGDFAVVGVRSGAVRGEERFVRSHLEPLGAVFAVHGGVGVGYQGGVVAPGTDHCAVSDWMAFRIGALEWTFFGTFVDE